MGGGAPLSALRQQLQCQGLPEERGVCLQVRFSNISVRQGTGSSNHLSDCGAKIGSAASGGGASKARATRCRAARRRPQTAAAVMAAGAARDGGTRRAGGPGSRHNASWVARWGAAGAGGSLNSCGVKTWAHQSSGVFNRRATEERAPPPQRTQHRRRFAGPTSVPSYRDSDELQVVSMKPAAAAWAALQNHNALPPAGAAQQDAPTQCFAALLAHAHRAQALPLRQHRALKRPPRGLRRRRV